MIASFQQVSRNPDQKDMTLYLPWHFLDPAIKSRDDVEIYRDHVLTEYFDEILNSKLTEDERSLVGVR